MHRLNPSSTDLSLLPDSQACNQALIQAEKAFARDDWGNARNFFNSAIRYVDVAPTLLYKRALDALETTTSPHDIIDILQGFR